MDLLETARTHRTLLWANRILGSLRPQWLSPALKLYRRYERRAAVRNLDRLRDRRELEAPRHVHFSPTYRCNLKCPICYQRHARGCEGMEEMPAEEALSIFRDLRPVWVKLIGGEVFLRDDIFTLIDGLTAMGARITVASNGTGIRGTLLDRLSRVKGVSELGLSLNPGMEARRGLWTDADGIGRLSRRFVILGKFHIQSTGTGEIPETISFLRGLGIGRQLAMFENTVSQADLEETQEKLNREMGWHPGSQDLHVSTRPSPVFPHPFSDLKEKADAAAGAAREHGVALFSNLREAPDQLGPYFEGRQRLSGRVTCARLAFPMLFVSPYGEVSFCEFLRHSFGNLREFPVRSIMGTNGEMAAFREFLDKDGLLPVCARCCNLIPLD